MAVWDADQPLSTDSPGIFPAKAQANWDVLFDNLGADHLFRTTTGVTDQGYHKIVHWVNQTDPAYINGTGMTYVKDALQTMDSVDQTAPQVFHRTSDGTTTRENPISPVPIRAYVTFDGSGAVAAGKTVYSQYNVTDVEKIATGRFIITFTDNMPSNSYAISAFAQRQSSAGHCFGAVPGTTTDSYANLVKVDKVYIDFTSGSSLHDPKNGHVTIYGG